MCDVCTMPQGWAEREAELECQVRGLEEKGVWEERERRKERESTAEQLKKNDLLIERYIHVHCDTDLHVIHFVLLVCRLQCELAESGQREREKEREKADSCSQLVHERQVTDELQATLDSVTSDLHR